MPPRIEESLVERSQEGNIRVTPSLRLIFTVMVDGYPDNDADEEQRCVTAYVKAFLYLGERLFPNYSVV